MDVHMTQSISIPVRNTKIWKTAAVAAVMFVVGLVFYQYVSQMTFDHPNRFSNPTRALELGGLFLVISVLLGLMSILSALKTAPRLVLTSDGIVENSGPYSLGFIPWADIEGFQKVKVGNKYMLYAILRDPNRYLSRCGFIKKAYLSAAMKVAPSPVAIGDAFEMNFNEIVQLIVDHHKNFG